MGLGGYPVWCFLGPGEGPRLADFSFASFLFPFFLHITIDLLLDLPMDHITLISRENTGCRALGSPPRNLYLGDTLFFFVCLLHLLVPWFDNELVASYYGRGSCMHKTDGMGRIFAWNYLFDSFLFSPDLAAESAGCCAPRLAPLWPGSLIRDESIVARHGMERLGLGNTFVTSSPPGFFLFRFDRGEDFRLWALALQPVATCWIKT